METGLKITPSELSSSTSQHRNLLLSASSFDVTAATETFSQLTYARRHLRSPWLPSVAFPQALGSQPDQESFEGGFKLSWVSDLVGLLEYVDKLRSVFSILLGEKGVGCASVAFSPCSTNPGDNVVVEYVQILAGSA